MGRIKSDLNTITTLFQSTRKSVVYNHSKVFFIPEGNTITVVQIAQKKGDSVAMKYRWMNMYTGELYRNIFHALVTILIDMIKLPQCRTTAMWQITRWKR